MRPGHKIIAAVAVLLVLAGGTVAFFELGKLRRTCAGLSDLEQGDYQAARQLSGRAHGALSSRNYSVASNLQDQALTRLGKAYADPSAVDDTPLALAAAKDAASRNDLLAAAETKQSVLDTRLGVAERKIRRAQGCHRFFSRFIH